ncbi:50S ribosomal protein L18 [Desulfobacca acetoxidans]|nr:50S ribosomal protein L18 [Desulfobacca acetoxidans]HAY22506.1 50S ribosomal protein L18 [Desulfobacterales bacterium]
MGQTNPKVVARLKRKRRVRKNILGVSERPRLSVFKSSRHIYAQIIDDQKGQTLIAASTLSKQLRSEATSLKKTEAARMVGKLLAEKAKTIGISQVAFDRNGFLYHGRIKELADSCREHGLDF